MKKLDSLEAGLHLFMEELDSCKMGLVRASEAVVGHTGHRYRIPEHEAVLLVDPKVDFDKRGICLQKLLIH